MAISLLNIPPAARKNEFLRGYTYDFIELFAPHLTRAEVEKAMHIK